MARSCSAVLTTLALAAGNVAVCAGWMGSAEARMACCSDGESCPMHQSDSQRSGSSRTVSQAQADSCCAASEKDDAAESPSTFTLNVSLGVIPGPVQVIAPATATQPDAWRTLVPLLVTHLPKHLLLSVILV